MVTPILEAHTQWVENEYGKHLEYTCPECGTITRSVQRYATIRCSPCDQIMQAANYDCSGKSPDPQNPKSVLRAIAKRRGLPREYYYPDEDEPSANDPLAF